MGRKVEIGMYVRTECGIAKVIEATEVTRVNLRTREAYIDYDYYVDRCFQPWDETKCSSDDIIGEPSFDILDVIEENDYVNGAMVVGFSYDDRKSRKEGIDEKIAVRVGLYPWEIAEEFSRDDIDTILTKEQYEQMCYSVLDEEVEEAEKDEL